MSKTWAGAEAPCQIYAMLDAGPGALERLAALFAAFPVASVLIAPQPRQSLTAALAKPLVDLAQSKGCAAMIQDDAALARTLRADGVHLTSGEDVLARYHEARSIVGGGAMVGADAGASRHVAMELGEAGADYIGFSPAPADVPSATPLTPADNEGDEDLGPRSQDALVAWWSEVFEVPCVALGAANPCDVRTFASLGADFVTLAFGGGETIAASVERLKIMVAAAEDTHVD